MPLLHLVVAALRPEVGASLISDAIERARALASAPGVRTVIVGGSDHELVVASWIDGRESLDAFAASPQHMAFAMQGMAPVIARMWTAAAEVDVDPPAPAEGVLWAFALPERPGVYEWQVRDLLAAVAGLPGRPAAGVTVEERDRYRAAGLVHISAAHSLAFEQAVEGLRAQWPDLLGTLEEARVPVVLA